MTDPRIKKMAQVLVNYSVGVKFGQNVIINGEAVSEPLLKEIYREVLKAGAHPHLRVSLDGAEEIFYNTASDAQLKYISPFIKHECQNIDAEIVAFSQQNTKSLTNIPAEKQALRTKSRKELIEILKKREIQGKYKWTLCLFPTHAYAQDAEMSLDEFSNFVFSACKLNHPDPVSQWRKLSKFQEKITRYLNKVSEIKLVAKETDLCFRVKGRKWINCDGKFNFPDGEVFTGPLENTMEGKVKFSYPACYRGREIDGLYIEFKKGKVAKACASKGEDFLHKMLDIDEGARYVGEFAFGTNEQIKHLTKNILFDEKIGGTFHMALGRSIPQSGGRNKSALHWDMICDLKAGGKVFADGKLIYKDGKFLIN